MNNIIIKKAKDNHNFSYQNNKYQIIVDFNGYSIELPNFENYYNTYLEYINFRSIPSDNKIKIEKYYQRHYLDNPILVDQNVLVNVLNFINS
jgi:hypothetical protein